MDLEHLEKADSLEEVLKQLFIINYCVHLDADRTQNKWSGKAASPSTRVQYILIFRKEKSENERTAMEWRADKQSWMRKAAWAMMRWVRKLAVGWGTMRLSIKVSYLVRTGRRPLAFRWKSRVNLPHLSHALRSVGDRRTDTTDKFSKM